MSLFQEYSFKCVYFEVPHLLYKIINYMLADFGEVAIQA